MSLINTLDGLRFHKVGPTLRLQDSEVEIDNLYRIVRVIQPFLSALDARGGLNALSLGSVGAGTSLIFDNTLPDFFLRSLVAGTQITITTSADGKEIKIASSGAGTHQLSDNAVHTDLGPDIDTNEDDGGEGGAFLAWDGKTNDRWELSDIGNSGSDLDTGADRRLGCFKLFEAGIRNFGSNNTVGGRHTMRMIETVSGSALKLTLESGTEDIQIALDADLDDLKDVSVSSPEGGEMLIFSSSGSVWQNETASASVPFIQGKFRIRRLSDLTTHLGGPEFEFRRSRDGSPTDLVKSGDVLGTIEFEGLGVTASTFKEGARIIATATEDFSGSAAGTKLEFLTVDDGSTTLDTRMTIDQDGAVAIAQALAVTGAITEGGIALVKVDGTVPLTADWDVGAFKVTAQQIAADIADGTTPLIVTSTTKVANLNAETVDAAGTARDWDTVQYTKQQPLSFLTFVTQASGPGSANAIWLTGSIGHLLTKVATGTPPDECVMYGGHIPVGFSATPVLRWRFYNDTVQVGGDQKDVLWRVQYNSPGSSGVVSAVDTGTPTTTLDTDQAVNTIKEESLALSNVAAGDLLNVTFSVDSAAGTTLVGDVVLLGVPWLEFTQAGLPDTGSAS